MQLLKFESLARGGFIFRGLIIECIFWFTGRWAYNPGGGGGDYKWQFTVGHLAHVQNYVYSKWHMYVWLRWIIIFFLKLYNIYCIDIFLQTTMGKIDAAHKVEYQNKFEPKGSN